MKPMTSKLPSKRIAEILARAEVCDDSVLTDYADIASAMRELQEWRKAALDSEPVAWKWRLVDLATGDPGEWRVTLTPSLPGKGAGYRTETIPLYRHAQPAPERELVKRFNADQMHRICLEANRHLDKYGAMAKEVNKLLGRIPAQPALVVMDDEKLRTLFDAWFASDCSFDQSPEASEADNIAWRESYWYVWQRCRAAMLRGGKP